MIKIIITYRNWVVLRVSKYLTLNPIQKMKDFYLYDNITKTVFCARCTVNQLHIIYVNCVESLNLKRNSVTRFDFWLLNFDFLNSPRFSNTNFCPALCGIALDKHKFVYFRVLIEGLPRGNRLAKKTNGCKSRDTESLIKRTEISILVFQGKVTEILKIVTILRAI
jgi:hypothetical protein